MKIMLKKDTEVEVEESEIDDVLKDVMWEDIFGSLKENSETAVYNDLVARYGKEMLLSFCHWIMLEAIDAGHATLTIKYYRKKSDPDDDLPKPDVKEVIKGVDVDGLYLFGSSNHFQFHFEEKE